jgi:ribosomal protein S18 acetylase RimI-like enzyme
MTVELRPITADNFQDVIKLEVRPEQSAFVAPNVDRISLSVVPSNESARKLYQSAGFVETGELDHGELVMIRSV